MNRGLIVSYFDKVSKTGYIATSVTQLALKVGLHRNTIGNMLKEKQWYEDAEVLVYSIENQYLIKRLPHGKGGFKKKSSAIEEETQLNVYL